MPGIVYILLAVTAIVVVAVILVRRNSAKKAAASSTQRSSANTSTALRSAISAEGDAQPTSTSGGTIPVPDTRVRIEAPPADQADSAEAEPEEAEQTAAQLTAEGDEHKRQGNYDDAIESYDAAIEALTAESGRESIAFADLLIKNEDAYYARDNNDSADEQEYEPNCNNYLRALSLYQHCSGVFHPKVLPVIDKVVSFYLLVGKVSEADGLIRRRQNIERLYENAKRDAELQAQAENLAPGTPQRITTSPKSVQEAHAAMRSELKTGNAEVDKSCADGDVARSEYDYEGAVEHYEAALEAAREAFGGDSVQQVPILVRLGEVYHVKDLLESNDDDDGKPYSDPADNMSLALSLLVRDGGPLDVRMVPVLVNLAAFADQAGDHYKADRYISMIENINDAQRRLKV